MHIDLIHLPSNLQTEHVAGRSIVAFDVLRATSTMVAALFAGVREIRVFDSLHAAADAAREFPGARALCGECNCLKPPGFDYGNSPGDFHANRLAGRTLFMCTTNGTRAIVAAGGAAAVFAGALVNAAATAQAVIREGRDVTLLCAGTGGAFALEDSLGAGAVLDALLALAPARPDVSDECWAARLAFSGARASLPEVLRLSRGGRNVINAGLEHDIDFAARLDALPIVARVEKAPLRVVRSSAAH